MADSKAPNGDSSKPVADTSIPNTSTITELSNAEKKKLVKAEKAARRAEKKGDSNEVAKVTVKGIPPAQKSRRQSIAKDSKPKPVAAPEPPKTLPHRHSSSVKEINFFTHLYGQTRRQTIEGSSKEIHPAILTLGLQLSSYTICGSQARCVAMLLALKFVIQSYTIPQGTSLPRHLSSHHLSPQLSHIKSSRPFSTTQGNAIRWLKNYIANIDPSVPETKAKNEICQSIDTFIRERFTIADQVIADAASTRIQDGDVVLTFGKSFVVQQTILAAAKKGIDFRVVVVDSRPLFEGRNLARLVASTGIPVTYTLLHGLAHVKATVCILGAHAVLGNGRLYSRVGTALVAMMAKDQKIPVICCAESIKFTERVALDSIVFNELAPEEELAMESWKEKENLQILNLLFDTTPVDFIDMIITEYGSLPPTSALAVQRMSV